MERVDILQDCNV